MTNKTTQIDQITLTDLREIVSEVLENVECRNSFPSVNVSDTDFGQSFYIIDENNKIRISDHSVSNFDRIMNEEHFHLSKLNIAALKKQIIESFSNNYQTLTRKNGENTINFGFKVLKSELKNWKTAKIWFKETQISPVLLSEIKNYEVLEEHDLTKKGDKRFCKVLIKKYSFGVKNIKTGQIEKTIFPVLGETDLEIKL